MTVDPQRRRYLGSTGLATTALGFGAAAIGGLFEAVPSSVARDAVDRAWDVGVRYFDVAPLYGYGLAERRLGNALRRRPRSDFVVSTKVGRLLIPADVVEMHPELERDLQAVDGVPDALFPGAGAVRPVFDFSGDGIRRSLESSLERLGLDRVDIVYLHDPDLHWKQAVADAYPTLWRLREQGVVGAIGVGMNDASVLSRFVRECDLDVILCAGRYTLLDQRALDELFPLCEARGVSVVVGGVMNSGVLVDPRPGARFDYKPVTDEVLARAVRLREACMSHGVPLRAAALQFAISHPVVGSLLAGVRTADEVDDTIAMLALPIPAAMWRDLVSSGLVPRESIPAAAVCPR